MSYYEGQNASQWPAPSNPAQQPPQASGWDHQTPPARSGASSAIPRDDQPAFVHQLEEVDRAIDNLMKSGKMFNMGGRLGRVLPPGGPRPHPMAEFGSSSGHNPPSNLQNYYSSQRHQSSRGSNEAESMIQAKRRMAAARERELRNYHQEQQYNRTVLSDVPGYPGRTGRTLSPGSMSEDERRELIARQRSALYGEGPFADSSGYVDEAGAARSGISVAPGPGAPGLRGPSPLAYDFTARSSHAEGAPVGNDPNQQGGASQRSRANSNSSPHSNAPSNKGAFDNAQTAQQSTRGNNASPGGSPPRQGAPIGTKQPSSTVAPIGTRPGATPASATQTAGAKRSTPPVTSPLTRAPIAGEESSPAGTAAPSNPASASAEGPVGLGGWGGRGGWGKQSGFQTSTSVWG